MNKKLISRCRELHLIFAKNIYEQSTDETSMTPEEIKNKRAQIPSMGIIPFDVAYKAGYEDGLNKMHEESN